MVFRDPGMGGDLRSFGEIIRASRRSIGKSIGGTIFHEENFGNGNFDTTLC